MSEETVRYVGIDLAKKTMEVCVLGEEEKEIKRVSSVSTNETGRKRLVNLLKKTDIIGMEACTYSFLLTRYIEKEVGCTVYNLNAGKLQMIWKSTKKTDKEDALKIAKLIQRFPEEELPLVALPSEKEEELRKYVSLKQFLTRQRTQLINRLHAIFVQEGITGIKKSQLRRRESRLLQMENLRNIHAYTAQILEKQIEGIEESMVEIREKISERVKQNELTPYIMSIPGVGMGLAAAFLAYIGDGNRFSKSSEVANYVGLVPRIDCSGETERYGHILKGGCRALRSVILQSAWALVLSKGGGRLQEKFLLLKDRIGKTKSAVAIARKMITLMWVLVQKKQYYADITKEQLERKFRYYKIDFMEWESIPA